MPIGVFLAVAVIHLSILSQYGVTWDEPLHRSWGKLFLLYWRTGNITYIEQMPGYGMFYGPLYHLLNYSLSEWLYNAGWLRFVEANHILNVLTFSLGAALLFALARSMFSKRVAWFATGIFVLLPHLIAHAQYNPKDIPLMTACLAAALGASLLLKRRSIPTAAVAGVLLGIPLAIKLSALILLPAFGAAYLIQLALSGRSARTLKSIRWDLLLLAAFTAAAFISVIVFWPTLWRDLTILPRGVTNFASGFWPGKVLYFGAEYAGDQLPWHYIPVHLLITTPLPTLALLVFGIAIAIRDLAKRKYVAEHALLLSWFLLPLAVSMKPSLSRYDGFRQFFFVLPALAILAGFGLDRLIEILRYRLPQWKSVWQYALPGLIAIFLLTEIWYVHPYEGSYMNQALRFFIPENIERSLELEYWGSTYKEGMQWLVESAKPDPQICVPIAGVLVTWYPWRDDFTFDCTGSPDYVMYFSRYSWNKNYDFGDREPVFEVRRYGSRLLAVFEMKREGESMKR